jgi:hypothetical protein
VDVAVEQPELESALHPRPNASAGEILPVEMAMFGRDEPVDGCAVDERHDDHPLYRDTGDRLGYDDAVSGRRGPQTRDEADHRRRLVAEIELAPEAGGEVVDHRARVRKLSQRPDALEDRGENPEQAEIP